MRYGVMILFVVIDACKIEPFSGPAPIVSFVSASLSDTTVAAGSPFVASARVSYMNCRYATINVLYGGAQVSHQGETFSTTFTAIAGDTVVSFGAYCGFTGAVPVVLTIHVTSAASTARPQSTARAQAALKVAAPAGQSERVGQSLS